MACVKQGIPQFLITNFLQVLDSKKNQLCLNMHDESFGGGNLKKMNTLSLIETLEE